MDRSVVNLVREVQRGNEDAFTQLYQLIYHDVFRIAYAKCKNYHDAHDITQETFILISKSIYQLKEPETFPYWIQKIVFSTTAKYYRKKRPISMDQEMMSQLHNQELKSTTDLPKQHFDNDEEQRLMQSFVKQLKPKYRDAIECVYLKQMTMEEAAAYLDRPLGTIKSQLFKGRKQLAVYIRSYEKKNDRKLGFHTCGSASFLGMITFYMKNLFKSSQIFWNMTTVIASIVLTIVVGDGMVNIYNDYHKEPLPLQQKSIQPTSNTIEEVHSDFHETFLGMEINSLQDAYYSIVKWGGTPEQAKQKSANEREEAKHLIDIIQSFHSIYSQRIEAEGWDSL